MCYDVNKLLATFNDDWTTNNSVTFGVGISQECFNVNILEDDIFELTENFYISISRTVPPITINQTTSAGISIEDSTGGVHKSDL